MMKCGADPEYCEDCFRPAAIQPWCRTFHTELNAVIAIARQAENADPMAHILEVLASSLTDLALSVTQDPERSIAVIRGLVTDRVTERAKRIVVVGERPGGPSIH